MLYFSDDQLTFCLETCIQTLSFYQNTSLLLFLKIDFVNLKN